VELPATRDALLETTGGMHVDVQRGWQLGGQQRLFTIAAMDTPNPFRSLAREWAALGNTASARTALRRWAETEDVLAGFTSPTEVVASCQRRGDPRAANAVLGALLRLADDPLAARAVLQAVLPSLAARAWRRRWDGSSLWDDVGELDAEMVVVAMERIAELAGTSPEWPSQAIVEVAYARLRWAAQVARRRQVHTVPLDAVHDLAAPDHGVEDDFADVLLDAVAAGGLRRDDAAVIYATRVLGFTPAEVAERQRRDVRAVRTQRARAERTLVAIAR
jgi:hypothetical protein